MNEVQCLKVIDWVELIQLSFDHLHICNGRLILIKAFSSFSKRKPCVLNRIHVIDQQQHAKAYSQVNEFQCLKSESD